MKARAVLLAGLLLAGCTTIESGVSRELALERKAHVRDIRYELAFRIPENKAAAVEGTPKRSINKAFANIKNIGEYSSTNP